MPKISFIIIMVLFAPSLQKKGQPLLLNCSNIMQNSKQLELIAEPSEFSMKQISEFQVGLKMVNLGSKTLEPGIHNSRLMVDGKICYAWDLAQNGPHEEPWEYLKPGEQIEFVRPLGEAMFPKEGRYKVTLELGEFESSVWVTVLP